MFTAIIGRIQNLLIIDIDDAIPQTEGKRSTSIPYWNENIKEHKERSLFWQWIWCEGGKINTGIVYNTMRRTRHQYHYAVRSARKHDTEHRKLRLAEASCANNSKDHMERSRVMFFVNCFKHIAVPSTVQNYGVVTHMDLIDA